MARVMAAMKVSSSIPVGLCSDRTCRCPPVRATVLNHAVESVGSQIEEVSTQSKRIVHVSRPNVSSLLARHSGRLHMATWQAFRESEVVSTDEGLPEGSPLLKHLKSCPEVLAQCQADVMIADIAQLWREMASWAKMQNPPQFACRASTHYINRVRMQKMCQVLKRENGTQHACVTLQALHGTMCPRVHADYVHLRALCTYLGPGTDYFPCEAVLMQEGRVAGAKGSELRGTNAGDLLFLKGLLDKGGAPAAHRSPEYDGNRLLLVVESTKDSPDVDN